MSKKPDSVARCSSRCSDAKDAGVLLQDAYRLIDELRALEITLDGLARDYVAGTRVGIWKSLQALEVAEKMISKG
jgi:hypothetical protein